MNEPDDTLPADPFVADQERFPEHIADDVASERIHEFLRRYETGDLLGGWVLFHEWINEDGDHVMGWTVAPGLDWHRLLGIVDAGHVRLRRRYIREEASGDAEDEDDEG